MKNRVTLVQEQLTYDALLIENVTDLFYLTGLRLSVGKLLITRKAATLFVDSRYIEVAKAHFNAVLETPESWKEALQNLKKISFDGSSLSWDRVSGLIKDHSDIEWISTPSPLKEIRAHKSPEELEKLKRAASLGSEGYDFLVKNLSEGISEKELVFKLDRFWKDKGAEGFSFDPIIAFGDHSALPHWHSNDRKLKKGDTVLLDIGVIVDDYHSDMTRTLFFGNPPAEMITIYEIVKEAQAQAIKALKPGILAKELDAVARDYIKSKGYGEAFSHNLGHGIGLETHEWPFLRSKGPLAETPLREGMCVTIEPGIYIPGLGGVRIEDTLEVTKEGSISLTQRSTELKVLDA